MSNHSLQVEKFLLHGLSEVPELQIFNFVAFFFLYLIALTENFLIISVIIFSPQLHRPMYFFHINLALQDVCSISVVAPKSMANSLMKTKSITYNGCFCQVFFLFFFTISHFFLLGVMAYDRYIAICNPLQYESVMNQKACIQMATSVWITGLFFATLFTGTAFTIEFCSNYISQFFCEISKFYKIACSDSYFMSFVILCVGVSIAFICLVVIVCSYVQIFRAVLKIPSTRGKQKTLSTCIPHLIVLTLYFFSGSIANLNLESRFPSINAVVISMFYCMFPPIANPLIYSIRNKELKTAFWKLTDKLLSHFLFPKHHSSVC